MTLTRQSQNFKARYSQDLKGPYQVLQAPRVIYSNHHLSSEDYTTINEIAINYLFRRDCMIIVYYCTRNGNTLGRWRLFQRVLEFSASKERNWIGNVGLEFTHILEQLSEWIAEDYVLLRCLKLPTSSSELKKVYHQVFVTLFGKGSVLSCSSPNRALCC